ncbi:MAG: LSU ribosomal protein L20p [Ktedonobacterales bacterium]|jgi:large subunit ribosomal protein L20|nr:MAG: LSU ribosomal protein L20p [Ktedonobacterales bacterium]
MPRVKRGVTSRAKHKKVLSRTQGHYGARHRLIKTARESMMHALRYAYRDRRTRKRDMRALWITRINAASRLYGMSYSQFMHGLALANVQVDRKVMADLAVTDLAVFGELVKKAQAAQATARAKQAKTA